MISAMQTPLLDEDACLRSDLWVDQPDALQRIESRLESGELNSQQANLLQQFAEFGFLTFRLDGFQALFDRLQEDVDRLWRERPIDLAFVYTGEPTSLADAVQRRHRRPLCKLLDLHSHSPAARELYLHPRIFEWTDRILGQPSLALQSTYFEYPSRLSPHRDAAYIPTDPPSHLLGVWVALEDVRPEAGPLAYVPGSHRIPYYQFSPGRIAIRPQEEDYFQAFKLQTSECSKRGLIQREFLARRGEVLIWHGSLVHGGALVKDHRLTRRSLVIHFTSQGRDRERGGDYWKDVRGRLWRKEPRHFWATTRDRLEMDGRMGMDNPLRGLSPRGLTLLEKLKSKF